jgi:type II secretory pathway pseudopilin PulG
MLIALVVGVLIVIGVVAFIYFAQNGQRRLDQEEIRLMQEERRKLQVISDAEDVYKNSLEVLKNNPSDANRKQECLQFGRELADLTRRYQGISGVTIFDELALMNDINAASAASPSLSTKREISQTLEERLAKLSELKEKNLLSEQEYNERRQKILDEI